MRHGVVTAVPTLMLAGVVGLTGCSSPEDGGPPPPPERATAAVSPPASTPEGRVIPAPPGTAIVVAGGALVIAADRPPRLARFSPQEPEAPPVEHPLPAPPERLTVEDSGAVVASVASTGTRLRLTPDGQTSTTTVAGGPVGQTRVDGAEVIALRNGRRLTTSTGEPIDGLTGADAVVGVAGKAIVLDRAQSSLTEVDIADRRIGVALRAGEGAVNMVTDRFGRVLAVDTLGGELLAFSTDPLLLRQRFPVPGGPYGMAYDRGRDLLWITLTERNEVVGLDVAGGEPVERHRFRTVGQPDAVAVDESTGQVYVLSARGEGIQVMRP